MSFERVMRRIGVKSVNTKDCEYVRVNSFSERCSKTVHRGNTSRFLTRTAGRSCRSVHVRGDERYCDETMQEFENGEKCTGVVSSCTRQGTRHVHAETARIERRDVSDHERRDSRTRSGVDISDGHQDRNEELRGRREYTSCRR